MRTCGAGGLKVLSDDAGGLAHTELVRRVKVVQAYANTQKTTPSQLQKMLDMLLEPEPLEMIAPAKLEVLELIRQNPGINVSELARRRGVLNGAIRATLLRLERKNLVRTELVKLDGGPMVRACYVI